MTKDDQVLSGLEEIPLPSPVPYTPHTIGWVLLAAVLVAFISYVLWRLYRRQCVRRYRKVALARLRELERHLADPAKRVSALSLLPELVKRTTLSFHPRSEVASLSDRDWLRFLDRTYESGRFTTGPGSLLPRLAYASPSDLATIQDAEVSALLALLRTWITHHHAHV